MVPVTHGCFAGSKSSDCLCEMFVFFRISKTFKTFCFPHENVLIYMLVYSIYTVYFVTLKTHYVLISVRPVNQFGNQTLFKP